MELSGTLLSPDGPRESTRGRRSSAHDLARHARYTHAPFAGRTPGVLVEVEVDADAWVSASGFTNADLTRILYNLITVTLSVSVLLSLDGEKNEPEGGRRPSGGGGGSSRGWGRHGESAIRPQQVSRTC